MEKATISIDIGSSGIRCCAFDLHGRQIAAAGHSYRVWYFGDGGAEQEAGDWEKGLTEGLTELYAKIRSDWTVAGIAMTGQCPTYLPVKRDMRPAGRAYIYQDNRARAEAEELAERFGRRRIHDGSGNDAQAFFILPKILWQRKYRPEEFGKTVKALQPLDYVGYLLTGELATGKPNACGTLAFDRMAGGWNVTLLEELNLPSDFFPDRLMNSTEILGEVTAYMAEKTGIPKGTRVVYGGPDSQCCCYGTGAVEEDILSNMSGTSTCLNSIRREPNPDLRVANYLHVTPDGLWCEEMGLNTTGASLKKVSGILFGREDAFDQMTALLEETDAGSRGLFYLPYLSEGERDDALIRGGFYHMTMASERGDFIRAVMEGVAFAEKERAQMMENRNRPYRKMMISGGGCRMAAWNQIKADVMGIPVYALRDYDAAEAGAAAIAATGVGEFADLNEAIKAYDLRPEEYLPRTEMTGLYRELYEAFIELENRQRGEEKT